MVIAAIRIDLALEEPLERGADSASHNRGDGIK